MIGNTISPGGLRSAVEEKQRLPTPLSAGRMMFDLGVSISPNKTKFAPLLFSGDLSKGMQSAKNLGYRGVELSLLDSHEIDQDHVLKNVQDLGLKVYAIATGQTYYTDGFSLYDRTEIKRQRTIDRLKGHIDFASRLDSAVIIGGIRGKIDAQGQAIDELKEKGALALKTCVRYAEEKGILLLLEPINRYETNLVNTLAEGSEVIKEIGSAHLKLLPDTFHMNIEERSFEESLAGAGSDIGYVHFADSNRQAPGRGHIDFTQIVSALERMHYSGPVGIEVLPEPDDYSAAEQAIRYLNSMNVS
jgi:sugar phosphate isomerase/epimerase